MSTILVKLRHEAMALTVAQPSEETKGFVIHKTYEEFLCELIVQECISQLQKQQYEHFNINRVPRTFYNAALYDGIVAIKKHFGVEE